MIIPIFAKKGTRKADGGTFYSFITTLIKKDGTQVKASVHFRRTAKTPDPNECPMMISFDRKNANFVVREFDKSIETDSGTETKHIVDQRLWLSDWAAAGEYVDTSLDDFAENQNDVDGMKDFDE